MRKLAIIGASELQDPLIRKAKEMGLETHVFAWEAGDIGEKTADVFHPISIVEEDAIFDVCESLGVSGVVTIATDLGNITASHVAERLGLVANTADCVKKTTDKHAMRLAFEAAGCPSPKSMLVREGERPDIADFGFPLIVKPTDRSGSRGITKLDTPEGLDDALTAAYEQGFEKAALIEEFAEGDEYSVEYLSRQGRHHFLALTEKKTTGAPHFIETGHVEPADVSEDTLVRVKEVTEHALDALGVRYGASHTELKIARDGHINIIEVGSRMGGDRIGSDLVRLSTGVDFVRAVLQVALGEEPDLTPHGKPCRAEVHFILSPEDLAAMKALEAVHPEAIVYKSALSAFDHEVTDSGSRFGFYIVRG